MKDKDEKEQKQAGKPSDWGLQQVYCDPRVGKREDWVGRALHCRAAPRNSWPDQQKALVQRWTTEKAHVGRKWLGPHITPARS